ncbi:type II secretion system minor pseudopilin GspK [Kaarinaea lacus]
MKNLIRRQQGVALITAMLIAALVTVAAVAMASRQTLDMRRTGNMMEVDQAYMYALGMEELAVQVLLKDKRDTGDIDTLSEEWAIPLPPTTVEGGVIAGNVVDMQSRFNLNNLVDNQQRPSQDQVRIFQSILQQVSRANEEIQISPFMANRVADWIDTNLNALADGAEDLEYLGADIPYRAANQFMASPSELGAILEMTPQAVDALIPFVSTLPIPTAINVNTAPAEILMGFHEDLTESIAGTLVEYRKDNPFQNKTDFERKLLDEFNISINNDLYDIKSDYFLVSVDATIGRTHIHLYSLLERRNDTVAAVRRSIGTY